MIPHERREITDSGVKLTHVLMMSTIASLSNPPLSYSRHDFRSFSAAQMYISLDLLTKMHQSHASFVSLSPDSLLA